jgi:small subunit ribosomal protein S9
MAKASAAASQQKKARTGRRKTSVARVRLIAGEGKVFINERPVEEYLRRDVLLRILAQPFEITQTVGKYDTHATCSGGGLAGQAGAIRHGITRALMEIDPAHRPALKAAGMVTRDARAKERKKYGQRSARARFQYSKR